MLTGLSLDTSKVHADTNSTAQGEGMKLFIGNLPYAVTESDISQLCSEFGEVVDAKLVRDPFSGQPKGFAFVEMQNLKRNAVSTTVRHACACPVLRTAAIFPVPFIFSQNIQPVQTIACLHAIPAILVL